MKLQEVVRFSILLSFLLIGLSCALSAPSGLSEFENDEAEDDPTRLPHDSHPLSYDITLWTAMNLVTSGARDFSGLTKIVLKIDENTNEIVLHNRNLKVEESDVKLTLNSDNIPVTFRFDQQYDFMIITSTEELVKDSEYELEIKYTSELDLGMAGFYRSSYRIENGTYEMRFLGTTQFQATAARRAFPCYDEPEFKATFKLRIHHHKSFNAISNTEGTFTDDGGDSDVRMTEFGVTPKMSSYLLAFIVSEFDYVSNESDSPAPLIKQRVYARPEFKSKLNYALDKSYKLLNGLVDYVNVSYEVDKMYSAAIPDFSAGAMENWGLITYKEQYLIVDESSHHREKFDSIRVIAHELGHQMFGNLVTCKWWDETWLNEGFATVFEFLLVEKVFPEHKFDYFFNILRLQSAFQTDALETTHPMTHYGNRNTRIVYDKSGSVIRMFQHVVTEEMNREALSRYLKTNEHEPVTADKLYEAYEEVIAEETDYVGFPSFTDAYKSWVHTAGVPMIHVKADTVAGKFMLTQERYYDVAAKIDPEEKPIWHIPLNYLTQMTLGAPFDKRFNYFMTEETFEIDFPELYDGESWYLFNKYQIGYYRVNYDLKNWNKLIEKLNSDSFTDIPQMNRAQLIDDVMTLASDNYISYGIALSLLKYLERETEYMPWRAALNHFDKFDFMLKGSPLHGKFRRFARKILRRFSFEFSPEKYSETANVGLVQSYATELVLDLNCRFKDETCLRETGILVGLEADGWHVDKSLQITVICNGLKTGDKTDAFTKLFHKLQSSNDQSERLRLIDGLLCSPDRNLLHAFLETTLINTTELNYKRHEIDRIYANMHIRSESGVDALLRFFEEYYDEFVRVISKGTMQSTLTAMSRRIVLQSEKEKFTQFLTNMTSAKIDANVISQINANMDFNTNWISGKVALVTSFVDDFLKPIDDIEKKLRLPKISHPTKYNVLLELPNLTKGDTNFKGEVEIEIVMDEASDFIQMHSRGHIIEEASAKYKTSQNNIDILEPSLLPEVDMLTIYFMETVPKDSVIIVNFKFRAQLLAGSSGFYITSYVNPANERKYLAATQFEPTRARHAFPNYDEPSFKAVFEVAIIHEKSLNAVANTERSTEPYGADFIKTKFEPTPLMSSYLNAFVVSDMAEVGTSKPERTVQHIYVRPDSKDKVAFALENSVAALTALEDYTGFKYELKKLDSASVPNKSGAMENWGMIIYRESAMIYDELKASHRQRLSGVYVIAHEVAHQFFGDSVTCEWWDSIWLNEGFATVFETVLMEMMHPDWNAQDWFNIDALHWALEYDSEPRRPMTHPVETLDEISDNFDSIAYDKSGSVLRMFRYAVGEEIFKDALKLYLEENDHQLVTSQHLIDAFAETMRVKNFNLFDFEKVFRTWELQSGYPYITVSYDSGKFSITQNRYWTNKADPKPEDPKWDIPLNFATKTHPEFVNTSITHIFQSTDTVFNIDVTGHSDADWYIFNLQQLGYYRVNYDTNNWNALINVLNSNDFDTVHVLNRAQLLNDGLNFAYGNYIDYNIFIPLMSYLNRETKYTPFAVVEELLDDLVKVFGSSNEALIAYVHHLSEKLYDSLQFMSNGNFPEENIYEGHRREIAIKLACQSGNEKCLADTTKMNQRAIDGFTNIPGGFEYLVMCHGLRGTGKHSDFVAIWRRMQATSSSDTTTRNRMIDALGCSDDFESLHDFLETILGDGQNVNYSAAERRRVFSAVLSNSRSGLPPLIEFLEKYETDVIRRLSFGTLEALLSEISREIKHQSQKDIFVKYLDTLDHLEATPKTNVMKIIDDNFARQNEARYKAMMEQILVVLGDRSVEVTTVEPTERTTETSTTTRMTSSSTSTSTVTPSTSTVTQSTSTATQSSSSSTVSTSTRSTDENTSTTTQGAAHLRVCGILSIVFLLALAYLR